MSDGELSASDATSLARVIEFVRRAGSTSRPEVSRETGFSRTSTSKYIDLGLSLGLILESDLGPSTGGRAPRLLRFNSTAGTILLAELGASSMVIATADLSGNISNITSLEVEISLGPDKVLAQLEKAFNAIISREKIEGIWGIGIGLPGPVEFATAMPISPPIMPGWDRYPVRKYLSEKYAAPVWVDNEVNLLALGEQSKTFSKRTSEMIYVKIGSGIGAGLITGGRLHRGAQGCAGDIGHIEVTTVLDVVCRCGNVGCLEAVAGGLALRAEALTATKAGKSKHLEERLKANKKLTTKDVIEGSKSGDKWCLDAITGAGREVGKILATLVNFHNPSLIVIGGRISAAGDPLLAAIRETVLNRSLPLATRDLEIRLGESTDTTGLFGAASMVNYELFESSFFRQWIKKGYPTSTLRY